MQASLKIQQGLHDAFVVMASLELWSSTSFPESVNVKGLHTMIPLMQQDLWLGNGSVFALYCGSILGQPLY